MSIVSDDPGKAQRDADFAEPLLQAHQEAMLAGDVEGFVDSAARLGQAVVRSYYQAWLRLGRGEVANRKEAGEALVSLSDRVLRILESMQNLARVATDRGYAVEPLAALERAAAEIVRLRGDLQARWPFSGEMEGWDMPEPSPEEAAALRAKTESYVLPPELAKTWGQKSPPPSWYDEEWPGL